MEGENHVEYGTAEEHTKVLLAEMEQRGIARMEITYSGGNDEGGAQELGTWFSAQLLRLIAKADNGNREKLRQVFPEHVAAYESYMRGGDDD